MANYDSPKSQPEGQWSPPQSYAEPHGYREPQEMSVTEETPRSHDGWNSPPIPPKGWTYDSPPPPDHEAPEVVPYQYDPHNSRPLSPASHGGTTAYSPRAPPYNMHDKTDPEAYEAPVPVTEEPKRFGMPKRRFNIILIIIIIVLLILGLALGLGLGLGLKKDDDDSSGDASAEIDPFCKESPELCIGGSLGAEYYSTKGAFNGSGIALAGESWNKDIQRIFTLYFQHWTGDIRYMQYTTDKKWIGGSRTETVATDAKNATALSTVAYALNGTQYFHVFYISKDDILKQVTYSNVTNIWEQGPLNKLNLKVYSSAGTIGMQACWKGNFYGDSDFSKMPTSSGQKNNIPFDDRRAMNIWYPIDDSTFQQYAWFNDAGEDWAPLDKWQGKNVHAGVGCYSWGEGTTSYTMMVNKANDTEFYWKDTANTTSTEKHPIQSWQNSTNGLIEDVYPSTSLGHTTYFYAQMADRSVKGFNITYQAENTTSVDDFVLSGPAGAIKGLGGTHLTATAYAYKPNPDDEKPLWDSLYVFYQTEGNDITAFTRPIAGGEWSNGKLEIPDE